jgi:hypothetical protein
MHTLVDFCDTSSPTYCFMAAALRMGVAAVASTAKVTLEESSRPAITLCPVLARGLVIDLD